MPEKPIDLRAEMRAAAGRLDADYRAALIDLGIDARDIDGHRGLCGIERVSISNGLYAPAPNGDVVVVTPVRLERGTTPQSRRPRIFSQWGPIVDLVAWHPSAPEQMALRVGAATWLGCIEPQYLEPEAVLIHRSALDWLRAGRSGLVLLSDEPADQYPILAGCLGGLVAADEAHARTLRRALACPWRAPTVEAAHACV